MEELQLNNNTPVNSEEILAKLYKNNLNAISST